MTIPVLSAAKRLPMGRIFALIAVGVSAASALTLAGCVQVEKQLLPTGGSRADATVELSYEVSSSEIPVIDFNQANSAAAARCAAWGYGKAEPFAGEKRSCTAFTQYGCYRWIVTRQYQCTK